MATARAQWGSQATAELVKLVNEKGTEDLELLATELAKKDQNWNYTKDQVHNHIETLRRGKSIPAGTRGRPPVKKRKLDETDEKGMLHLFASSLLF